ncbi:hypothetical protein SAMN05216345_101884 [Cupriavidus sp. YR651]|uniref:DUF6753 family protein n=1 Tax=Cupriavidus sp. YR651 TaxID=1855315 RepID=UPI00088B8D6B|nr:DUF6753 family protein [Cupriavidus sp. YR651]SDC19631.1 hypothetical protein SAMN05216345_101884 [Cupriavidus sp. YR651]
MTELDDRFAKLLRKQPTEADRQDMYRLRDSLGLKNNDALWDVLIALQYHQKLYERMPAKIAKASQETLTDFRAAADSMVKASAEAAKADLAKAVATSAREVACQVAGKQKARWMAGCAAVLSLAFAGLAWAGYSAGRVSGYGDGYAVATDEKAAAAWANTPEGRAAYRLAQAGSIGMLVRCDQPGWAKDKGFCFVGPASDQTVYGWKLP